ncbi:MAG: hypothetical protein HQ481_00335 [Alphaproteobacteria bacterium]|nr:hypothetical protein [Alphaproteobacteria bacterium]
MIMRRDFVLGGLSTLLVPRFAKAQCAPIDLGIPNIQQQTQVWCWAAVAEQIITWKQGGSPPQCALVAMANGAPPGFCCNFANPQCVITGQLQQIQWLIGQFGGSFTSIAPSAPPDVVYNTLANGRAIIMAVQSSPYSGHVVVVRGMSCYGPNPVLHINDPIGWPFMAQPVPFQQIAPFWQAAIVVS